MSESVLYRVYNKSVRTEAEYQNSWLSAPLLWDYLAETYLGRPLKIFGDQELWSLVTRVDIPRHMRLALAMTLDRALCPKERIQEVAQALLEASKVLPDHSHWKAIAEDMEKAKDGKRMQGLGLTCTSISDVWQDWENCEGKKEAWDIFEIFAKDPALPPSAAEVK